MSEHEPHDRIGTGDGLDDAALEHWRRRFAARLATLADEQESVREVQRSLGLRSGLDSVTPATDPPRPDIARVRRSPRLGLTRSA